MHHVRPYPQEFRDDVVRVALNREPGTQLKVIAKDFGISFSCLTNWMRQAEIEAGNKPGTTKAEAEELRTARRRIRLQEQENEVMRRAGAYLSQANLPKKDVPARVRARRRPDPGRGVLAGPQARPPALLPLAPEPGEHR